MSADRIGGAVWFVFGAAVLYGSWTMDRLTSQSIQPFTAPGLLPGLLGVGMIALALVLLSRRRVAEGAAPHEGAALPDKEGTDWKRLLLSWLLCIAFAGVLLGRGLPFWLLAGVFVFVHMLALDDRQRIENHSLVRRVVEAGLIAAITSAVVTAVFQSLFLIRLP